MTEIDYFNSAPKYLLSFEAVTDELLDARLYGWQNQKPKDLKDLFRVFLDHVQNRQGMPNSIGDISKLGSVLYNFDALKVKENYPSWAALFDAVKEGKYKPPGRMDKNNNRSYWVHYCKSIISIADFMSAYASLEDFEEFIEGFLKNEHSRLALPLLIGAEIHGYGFALACDFIKETGHPEFVKPDTHLNDIARAFGITDSKNNFKIFKDTIAYCQRINEYPYVVDKMFWMVGSGKVFDDPDKKIDTSKRRFIEMVKAGEL